MVQTDFWPAGATGGGAVSPRSNAILVALTVPVALPLLLLAAEATPVLIGASIAALPGIDVGIMAALTRANILQRVRIGIALAQVPALLLVTGPWIMKKVMSFDFEGFNPGIPGIPLGFAPPSIMEENMWVGPGATFYVR